MKKTFLNISAALLLLVCILAITGCGTPEAWETNLATAQEKANAENKDILLFFSGNEWDGTSPNLMAKFLSNKKFMKEAGKEFILFTVNIPADVSTISDEEYTSLMILTGTCGVNTCPTIVICDTGISPYYQLSYENGVTTLDDMIADVQTAGATKKIIKELEGKLQTVQGAERVKVIDQLVSSVPADYTGRYYELMSTIPTIDPDNESGLVGKYMLVAAEEHATELMYSGDIIGAIDEFAKTSDSEYLTTSQKQECLYYASYFAMQADLLPEMLDYMERAYNLDPTSETGIMLAEIIPQMKVEVERQLQEQALQEE